MLIQNSLPITLHDSLLTFRDTGKIIELKGEFLKMITKKNCIVDLADFSHNKLMYDSAKQMNFDVKGPSNKSTRYRTLTKLFKSPAMMASGISKTRFSSSDPIELCDRLKLILQEKKAGNNSEAINEEIVAIVDKLLEHKCISTIQHKQILIKCNLLHIKKK